MFGEHSIISIGLYSRHPFSSDKSPQSLSPSQRHLVGIHFPEEHANDSELHVMAENIGSHGDDQDNDLWKYIIIKKFIYDV